MPFGGIIYTEFQLASKTDWRRFQTLDEQAEAAVLQSAGQWNPEKVEAELELFQRTLEKAESYSDRYGLLVGRIYYNRGIEKIKSAYLAFPDKKVRGGLRLKEKVDRIRAKYFVAIADDLEDILSGIRSDQEIVRMLNFMNKHTDLAYPAMREMPVQYFAYALDQNSRDWVLVSIPPISERYDELIRDTIHRKFANNGTARVFFDSTLGPLPCRKMARHYEVILNEGKLRYQWVFSNPYHKMTDNLNIGGSRLIPNETEIKFNLVRKMRAYRASWDMHPLVFRVKVETAESYVGDDVKELEVRNFRKKLVAAMGEELKKLPEFEILGDRNLGESWRQPAKSDRGPEERPLPFTLKSLESRDESNEAHVLVDQSRFNENIGFIFESKNSLDLQALQIAESMIERNDTTQAEALLRLLQQSGSDYQKRFLELLNKNPGYADFMEWYLKSGRLSLRFPAVQLCRDILSDDRMITTLIIKNAQLEQNPDNGKILIWFCENAPVESLKVLAGRQFPLREIEADVVLKLVEVSDPDLFKKLDRENFLK